MAKLFEVAKGKWDVIFQHYGIPITKGNRHFAGPCPLCKKKGKFRLFSNWIMTGAYVCVCSNGSGIDLIVNLLGKPYNEVAHQIYKLLNYNDEEIKSFKPKKKDRLKPILEFNKLLPIAESQVEQYLNSRHITLLAHKAVRYSPNEYYDKKTTFPAMRAIATNEEGQVIYKHCTYIVGGVKIPREVNRKMFKVADQYSNEISIKLFNLGELSYMGVAEGIETSLSAAQMYDIPVWATMNSTYLKKFKAPKGIKDLFIYADNDHNGTGLHAAFECGRNNILTPNDIERVHIYWPKQYGDFNDIVTGEIPHDIIKWKLIK